MRSFDSIALRLRRNTNRAFVPSNGIAAPVESLGTSLGSYFLHVNGDADWMLFKHGVWDRKNDRAVNFAEVKHILPETLTAEPKLLHFSPTLVLEDAAPLYLPCKTRDDGERNHGWAICDALRDIMALG